MLCTFSMVFTEEKITIGYYYWLTISLNRSSDIVFYTDSYSDTPGDQE